MVDLRDTPLLSGVRETIREPLQFLSERLQSGLGSNLKSVTVVGSSLTDDFNARFSDVNTVVVLNEYSIASLNLVASLAGPLSKKRLSPPLLMTPSHVERSRDVFGMELLDFQLTHETILGGDPFASLTFEKNNVRLQCERELKATLVRLRQGYIACGGDPRSVHGILIEAAKGLASVVRAMLWLKEIDRPRTMTASLHRAAEHFKMDLNAVVAAQQWRYEKPRWTGTQTEESFAATFTAVDRLATIVDEFEL